MSHPRIGKSVSELCPSLRNIVRRLYLDRPIGIDVFLQVSGTMSELNAL
jgi:hypothetical protein